MEIAEDHVRRQALVFVMLMLHLIIRKSQLVFLVYNLVVLMTEDDKRRWRGR
jgi:hypothetical protein